MTDSHLLMMNVKTPQPKQTDELYPNLFATFSLKKTTVWATNHPILTSGPRRPLHHNFGGGSRGAQF
jgi:hypothetical protein